MPRICNMTYKLVFLVALTASLSLSAQTSSRIGSNLVEASNPDILVEGRYVTSPQGGVRLGFPGVVLHLRFHGSALKMRMKSSSDEAFFDVTVDQGQPTLLRTKSGEHDYTLLDAADPSDHLAEIAHRTESWQGVCDVIAFDLGEGGVLLSPPPLPGHKLLFIGDSITCGARADYRPNETPDEHTQHDTLPCDAQLTFCKILARQLHAQCQLVSYGGRGLTRDWQGQTNDTAPEFYRLALPDDPSSLWDPNRYVPDAVGICLGGNDFNRGIPDQNHFVNTYAEFVKEIRRDAPHAWIFLLDCPMLRDVPGQPPTHTILHKYLQETVAKLDDPRVAVAPVSYFPGNPKDHHPTRGDHEAIAAELKPLFEKALTDN